MKALKYTAWILFFLLSVLYILPAVLLQVPSVQKKISVEVTDYLENKLETEVHIDRIELGLFNRLVLKEVFMEDQQGDTLLSAKRISARFEFFPLFKKKFRFDSVQLYSFSCNLSKETADSPLNIQYIIDAFKKKDEPDKKTPVDLNIKKINLRMGRFSYRIKDKKQTPEKFNPNDIELNHFSAKINLNTLTEEKLDLFIDRLSCEEKSGLHLDRLSFDLKADSCKATIDRFNLDMPATSLIITNIFVNYGDLKQLKNRIDEMAFHLSIEPSFIGPKDLSAIVPELLHYKEKIALEGSIAGTINDFVLTDFSFSKDNELFVEVNGKIQQLMNSNPDHIYVEGNVASSFFSAAEIQRIISIFNKNEAAVPQQIAALGNLHFKGDVAGRLNHLTTHGEINTDIGDLLVDLVTGKNPDRFISGKVSTKGLDMKKLMNSADFGLTVFDIEAEAAFLPTSRFSGHINADIHSFEYKQYNYEQINLNGDFTRNGFNGTAAINNPNGKINLKGAFELKGADSEFDFSADVSNLYLDRLNLTKKYINPQLSFVADAHFTGNKIDNLLGNVNLRQVFFYTDEGNFYLDNFEIQSDRYEEGKEIRIISNVMNGEIRGNYSFPKLIPELKQTLSAYLPSLFPASLSPAKATENLLNDFYFHFTFDNSEKLSSVLKLPFTFYETSFISGAYNSLDNKWIVDARIPDSKIAGSHILSGEFKLRNQADWAELNLEGIVLQKKGDVNFHTSFTAKNDSVFSTISWNNIEKKEFYGKVAFNTHLFHAFDPHFIAANIDVKQSQLTFNDSIWTLYPASIRIHSNDIDIVHLKAQHRKQFIEIDGEISHSVDKQLMVELNDVDLEYIFQALDIGALKFGGIAKGKVFAKDLYHTRQLSTYLDVVNFSFNDAVFGHLKLNGLWDDENQGVKMMGDVTQKNDTVIKIDGMIYPVAETLSIDFDTKGADASFIRKYVNKVVRDFSGQVTGNIRLFGNLNRPTVEGIADVKNGRFGIGFLNTYYNFSDRVILYPDKIFIENATFYDDHHNQASVSAFVTHELFRNFHFGVNIDCRNFMVYNATRATNPTIYGTVYGTGNATLKGTEDAIDIVVSLQNTENSKITLNFMNGIDIEEYNFIRFVNKEKDSIQVSALPYLPLVSENKSNLIQNKSKTEVNATLSLNVNPYTAVDLLMSAETNDKINATGNGILDIQYGTSIPLSVRGKYTIEKGKYNFSLQQFLFRNFDIQEGSSVTFKGDPYVAVLDINAAYKTSANLGDLNQDLTQKSVRNNVPVDCILMLNGTLNHPDISFNLDMPNASPELLRQVKSYISTEDMMNRQILYLLVLGRFFPSEYAAQSDAHVNNDWSFLTSTLSSQLSNILGNISDKFQVGTKFHQSYEGSETNTEVELLLSSTLWNDRLVLNGNFGYVNNSYLNAQTNGDVPIVGDFDVEYKLTKMGDIRLKGFNRYNYRNLYSKSPEMTQGIGILFRKDFDHFYDLFKKKINKK